MSQRLEPISIEAADLLREIAYLDRVANSMVENLLAIRDDPFCESELMELVKHGLILLPGTLSPRLTAAGERSAALAEGTWGEWRV
jgi:hypothetical protein